MAAKRMRASSGGKETGARRQEHLSPTRVASRVWWGGGELDLQSPEWWAATKPMWCRAPRVTPKKTTALCTCGCPGNHSHGNPAKASGHRLAGMALWPVCVACLNMPATNFSSQLILLGIDCRSLKDKDDKTQPGAHRAVYSRENKLT